MATSTVEDYLKQILLEELEGGEGRVATGRIAQVLGYSNGDEVIHRDDLVVLDVAGPGEGSA